ncbi:MAG: hypothetical protein M5U09_26110 [Gammaproteobacteria bacterium]|nr:hypothetical protein [Gammaproteobacteria bacterium]
MSAWCRAAAGSRSSWRPLRPRSRASRCCFRVRLPSGTLHRLPPWRSSVGSRTVAASASRCASRSSLSPPAFPPGWFSAGGPIGAGALVLFAAVVIVMVWVTNLYNFMDGMDGLAASHAVIVFTTFGLWLAFRGAGAAASFCFIAAAATLAFLLVNWHPARVFMGDTGSLALGMGIAAVAFDGMFNHGIAPAAFAIVMGVFLFDATFTLLRRMLGGERWWRPHRSHLYQRARRSGFPSGGSSVR